MRWGPVDATDSGTWQVGTTPHVAASPAGPARARGWRLAASRVPRPVLQGLLAFALYLALFIGVYAAPLISHLNGQQPHLDLPLDVQATAFQR